MTATVLLTGAGGFLGTTVLRMAAAGEWHGRYEFVTLGSSGVEGYPWIDDRRDVLGHYRFSSDAFRQAGINKIDSVLHLGAFTPKSAGDRNNASGSLSNIVNVAHLWQSLPNSPRRFVFASSIDVYGEATHLITEDISSLPSTLYGHSKAFGENLITELVSSAPSTELVILRLGHTYGPGEDSYRKFIPNVIRQLIAGRNVSLEATGYERRAFIFSEDCCRFLLKALDVERPRIINVASRSIYSLIHVAETILDLHEECSGSRAQVHWHAGNPPNAEVIPDVSRMEALLGKERVSLRDGLLAEYAAFSPVG